MPSSSNWDSSTAAGVSDMREAPVVVLGKGMTSRMELNPPIIMISLSNPGAIPP